MGMRNAHRTINDYAYSTIINIEELYKILSDYTWMQPLIIRAVESRGRDILDSTGFFLSYRMTYQLHCPNGFELKTDSITKLVNALIRHAPEHVPSFYYILVQDYVLSSTFAGIPHSLHWLDYQKSDLFNDSFFSSFVQDNWLVEDEFSFRTLLSHLELYLCPPHYAIALFPKRLLITHHEILHHVNRYEGSINLEELGNNYLQIFLIRLTDVSQRRPPWSRYSYKTLIRNWADNIDEISEMVHQSDLIGRV